MGKNSWPFSLITIPKLPPVLPPMVINGTRCTVRNIFFNGGARKDLETLDQTDPTVTILIFRNQYPTTS
jgi:hypothetical protein